MADNKEKEGLAHTAARGFLSLPLAIAKHPVLFALVVVSLCAVVIVFRLTSSDEEKVEPKIKDTPVIVQEMRRIGQWEFSLIEAEIDVDTTIKGIFKDDELVMTFPCKASLGIDFAEMSEGWIEARGDSAWVRLPEIKVLNDNVADEIKGEVLFEKGSFKLGVQGILAKKAEAKFAEKYLGERVMARAKSNAEICVGDFLRAMGYKYVEVAWGIRIEDKGIETGNISSQNLK